MTSIDEIRSTLEMLGEKGISVDVAALTAAYQAAVDELVRTEGDLAVAIREAGRARDALRAIRRCVNSYQVPSDVGALIRQTVHDGLGE